MAKFIKLLKDQDDFYFNFGKDTHMIIITGLSGSGKSNTSFKISKQFNYPLLSFDFLFDYEERNLSFLENDIFDHFLEKHPKYKDYHANRSIADEVCICFFEYVRQYVEKENIHLVVDSAYFFQNIPIEKISNQRIIVKGTSLIRSVIRANKRDVIRQYHKDISLLKKTVRTFKIPIISLLEISNTKKNYVSINNFLEKLSNLSSR